jgi:hypothetical protein
MSSRFRALLLPLLAVCACLPPLSGVEGKACDEAHPCPDALFCVANVCSVDDATVNPPAQPRTVFSDDCETAQSWTVTSGRFFSNVTPARTGAGACRLQAAEGSATAFGLESSAIPVQSGTYCARAFLQQGVVPTRTVLTLRRYGGSSGTTLVEESPPAVFPADAGSTAWRAVSSSFVVDLASTAAVKVALSADARAQSSVLFDDLVVTQLPLGSDAGCP